MLSISRRETGDDTMNVGAGFHRAADWIGARLTPAVDFTAKAASKIPLKVVDVICRLALAVLSALTAPIHFAVSASIGAIFGASYACYKIHQKAKEKAAPQNDSCCAPGAKPTCAQGFYDYLSNVKTPVLISTAVTAVYIGHHLHASPFFVAFCGVPLGFYTGKEIVEGLASLPSIKGRAKKIKAPKPVPAACCHRT